MGLAKLVNAEPAPRSLAAFQGMGLSAESKVTPWLARQPEGCLP